jgi:hypothetical protein
MTMNRIIQNSIIEWLASGSNTNSFVERVLWCHPDRSAMYVINLNGNNALPVLRDMAEVEEAIEQNLIILRTVDPYASVVNQDPDFLEKHRKRMESIWGIIKDLVANEPNIYASGLRGKLIKDISDEKNVSLAQMYSWLRKYWIKGKVMYALLPDYGNCGGVGKKRIKNVGEKKRGRPTKLSLIDPEMVGVNVDMATLVIFRRAYKEFFNTKQEKPLHRAFNEMCKVHYGLQDSNGKIITPPAYLVPTFKQFKYWHNQELNLEKTLIDRKGKRNFLQNNRHLLCGSTGLASGPGSIYQIDATVANVYLVARFRRSRIIGRPVIYFCVDVFSRMITGIHVALEGPNWTTGMMALSNSILDKVEFCSRYGITISPDEWPCFGLPEQITADRGEFLSINSDYLVETLDVTFANCPPYRPDWKGIIEKTFGKADDKVIKWLPGAVREREFGEQDYRFDAKLDIYQFTKILINMAKHHNLYHYLDTDTYPLDRDLMRDGVPAIPIELWHWGLANRSGRFREKSPEAVMLSLMPRGKATVTMFGIKFLKMFYICESALQHQWFIRARNRGTWKIDVSYDPRKPEVIYFHRGKGAIEPCNRIVENDHNKRFDGLWLEEILEYQAIESMGKVMHESTTMQSEASLMQCIDEIIAEGTEMTDAAIPPGMSKRKQIENIKANGAQENAELREEQAWDLRPNSGNGQDKHANVIAYPSVKKESGPSPVTTHRLSIFDQIEALEQVNDN